jgi:hypothetical protein
MQRWRALLQRQGKLRVARMQRSSLETLAAVRGKPAKTGARRMHQNWKMRVRMEQRSRRRPFAQRGGSSRRLDRKLHQSRQQARLLCPCGGLGKVQAPLAPRARALLAKGEDPAALAGRPLLSRQHRKAQLHRLP